MPIIPLNPANAPECNVTLTNAVPTYFMKVLGIPTVNLTAYAEAILIGSSASGPFNYALFSNTNLNNWYAVLNIQGLVYANEDFTINGSDNIIKVRLKVLLRALQFKWSR